MTFLMNISLFKQKITFFFILCGCMHVFHVQRSSLSGALDSLPDLVTVISPDAGGVAAVLPPGSPPRMSVVSVPD